MVVDETYQLDQEPGERATSFLFENLNTDWGRIEPHRERFPAGVEDALFALLLAPWEDWVEYPDVDWRGFRVPWIYIWSDDIFIRPSPPPSPDTLSWEPDIITDMEGNVVFETERPLRCLLNDAAAEVSSRLTDTTWFELARARQSPLFETPIAHFLVGAFLADDVDEFLAHITTVEAALGLESDYSSRGGTKRVAARVSALLGAKADGDDYRHLFDLRSAYLHGRTMRPISSQERLLARRLARRAVKGLVEAALAAPALQSREAYLRTLG